MHSSIQHSFIFFIFFANVNLKFFSRVFIFANKLFKFFSRVFNFANRKYFKNFNTSFSPFYIVFSNIISKHIIIQVFLPVGKRQMHSSIQHSFIFFIFFANVILKFFSLVFIFANKLFKYFSRVFNFANRQNSQKLVTAKISTPKVHVLNAFAS